MMIELGELEIFNSWWKTGKPREDLLEIYKRKLYHRISKYLDKRQIILLQGLRRTGKTVILFQIIQHLLNRKVKPKNILYFSFDESSYDIKEILETYQKLILEKTFENVKDKIYIFLDEVQKVEDWENKIKVFYDLYPNLKIIISGSSSIKLRKRSKESLAGRIIDFTLQPLEFDEFLELNNYNLKKIRGNLNLFKREILPSFYRYLKYGSFPELAKEEDEEFARNYILNSVIERVIYKDIPKEFEIKEVELLKRILYLIGKNPGGIVNFKEIGKNFGRDERTISNYFEYLEYGLLIKFIFNYRGSPLATMRKLKKVYFSTPNLIFGLNPSYKLLLPNILENLVASVQDIKYFYHNKYEIDFIREASKISKKFLGDQKSPGDFLVNEKIDAIEVKLEGKKLKQLKKFVANKNFSKKLRDYFIIDLEKEGKEEEIRIVPAWKWLLIER